MRWITFDCYGTLVDWRTGISRAIEALARGHSALLLPLYYRHEAAIQRGPFQPYRAVLATAFQQAAADAGLELGPAAGKELAEQLPDWPVFPDVKPSLMALKEDGWQVAVLSNIDRDLFAATRRHLPVPIDAVITAEDVRSYKPAPGHFQEFVRRYHPQAQLHAAQSFFHDVVPAHDLGIPVVWINRLGERQDRPLADAELPDLRDLPETVRSLQSAALGS